MRSSFCTSTKAGTPGLFETNGSSEHTWHPLTLFSNRETAQSSKYICCLLNIRNKYYKEFESVEYLWTNSDYRIAVDGGANCLCDLGMEKTIDLLCGDFDSIDASLLTQLSTNKTTVIKTPDQDETDFTKAMNLAIDLRPDLNTCVTLFKNDGSRVDHLFGIVNTLHKSKMITILVDIGGSIHWLLPRGKNVITKLAGSETCSLVPFGGPTTVTTRGLVWDMNEALLQFGGMVSTANKCCDHETKITVETDRPILWTIDYKWQMVK